MGFFSSPRQASLAVDTAVEACQVSSADLEVRLSLGRGISQTIVSCGLDRENQEPRLE